MSYRVCHCLATAVAIITLAGCGQHYSDKNTSGALAERGLTAYRGASQVQPVSDPHAAASSTVASPDANGHVRVGEYIAVLPQGWVAEKPSSTMRVAQFSIGNDADGHAELAVFVGNWGTVDDNVIRWMAQFTQPDGSSTDAVSRRWEVESIGGITITMVDIPGTFGGGMGGGSAQTNYRMLAAIVPGNGTFYYLKFTGPSDLVVAQSDAFNSLVLSLTGG